MSQVLTTVVQILPSLIQIVMAVEKAIPNPGTGAAKLQLATDILKSTYAAANEAMPVFAEIEPVLEGVFGSIVKTLNSTGVLGKK